jgi:hypothetical protein
MHRLSLGQWATGCALPEALWGGRAWLASGWRHGLADDGRRGIVWCLSQESKDLDWKGRKKEWSQKLKKETRNQQALEESRVVIKEELDEVVSQLSEQRHSALNFKSMLMSVKGEKQSVDVLISQSEVSPPSPGLVQVGPGSFFRVATARANLHQNSM